MIPIQLRTDGISGEKRRASESTEAIERELRVIGSLQTQLSSAKRAPRMAGGQHVSADDGVYDYSDAVDIFPKRDNPGSAEM